MRDIFSPTYFTPNLGALCIAATLGFLALSAAVLRAETVNYSTDRLLVETRVDMTPLYGKSVTLAEVFTFVENQTNLNFLYVSERIPIHGRIILQLTGVKSLTELFSTLSSAAPIVFEVKGFRI